MSWSITQVPPGELALTSTRWVPFLTKWSISDLRRNFTQDAAFTKVFTLNVQRVFTVTQKCLPLLRAAANAGGQDGNVYKDPSRVINVSDVIPSSTHNLPDTRPVDWIYRRAHSP